MIVAEGYAPYTCRLKPELYNETAYLVSDDYKMDAIDLSSPVKCDDQFYLFYVNENGFGGARAKVHVNFDEDGQRLWEGPFIMLCAVLSQKCDEADKLYHAIRNKDHLEVNVNLRNALGITPDEYDRDMQAFNPDDVDKYYGTYTITVDPV